MSVADNVKKELKKASNKEYAKQAAYFFKTGEGQYGEGDIFIGVRVPDAKAIIKKYHKDAEMKDIDILVASPIHEERMAGVSILVHKFSDKKKSEAEKKTYFDYYIKNGDRFNNWDLVDLSAPKIAGKYLLERDRKVLYTLAKSTSIWRRRIAIICTHTFIKNGDIDETFKLSELLFSSPEDLMHKAIGWMLRETGKIDMKRLKAFIIKNYEKIPRTTLRYAIEKFPENERKKFLKGEF
jgi:3-methyladenine DNA glycosylase AlkD